MEDDLAVAFDYVGTAVWLLLTGGELGRPAGQADRYVTALTVHPDDPQRREVEVDVTGLRDAMGPWSSSERARVELALSLLGVHRVDLRGALGQSFDQTNTGLVAHALELAVQPL